MDDLLREAIADAKAVRETALENAKIALEEAFTPRLQSMLSKKIATEVETDEEEAEERDDMKEEESDDKEAEEMNREMSEDEVEDLMSKDEEEVEDEESPEEMKMDADELESDEIPMDADEEEEEEMAGMEEEEEEENDDLDLESVLAELEKDLDDEDSEDKVDETEKSDKDEEEKVDENDVSSDIGKSDNKVNPEANDSSKTGAQGPEGEGKDEPAGNELDDHEVVKENEDKEEEEMDEDLDLDEVLKALSEEEDAEEEADKVDELKKEIKETRDVVKFMRAKLNEVNLLNAKLLFSNKLFRAFGLNNDQKLKVVENFDRTTNLREVKLVYATLAESFKKPSRISESVSKGSSSKPVASTKPAKEEVLSEGAELKARFKKLANIL